MNKDVKEVTKEDPKVVCQFCHSPTINPLEWGPLYKLEGVTVHYFCLLFSSGINQNGEDDEGIQGFLPGDIRTEIKRGNKLKCKFCRKPNATIGCWKATCRTSYHYPCGVQNRGVFQFIGGFRSYCSKHKKVKIPVSPNPKDRCPICLHEVTKRDNYLWPPCCKKDTLFHKKCVMEMGNSHGVHFFKCPLCNDKEIFSVAMRKAGVFLPDRDAAWETEPNAFAEQREQYKRCDAGDCLCPKGRAHSSKTDSKPWKIVRCGGCGSSAIHKLCGKLKNLTWRCPTCANILSDKRKSGVMALNSPRIQRDQHHHHPISDLAVSGTEEGVTAPPRKKMRLDDTESSSGSSVVALSSTSSSRRGPSSSVIESSSESASSSSASESSDSESDQDFVPRHHQKNNAKADSGDSGSTEDEKDEQDEVFISSESNVYQQLANGATEPKLVVRNKTKVDFKEPAPKKLSLKRSSEEVTYPAPPSNFGTQVKSSNQSKPPAPPPPAIGPLSVSVSPLKIKMDVSVEDEEMDEWNPCLLPQVVLEESSSPLKIPLEGLNCQSENAEEEMDDEEDDNIPIAIVSCVSLASPPETTAKDEDEQEKTDNKDNGLHQAGPNSPEDDLSNSKVPSPPEHKKDSEPEGLPLAPEGRNPSPMDLDDEEDSDSDIDIENVEPSVPAIMSLIKKHRTDFIFTAPAAPSSFLSRIQRKATTLSGNRGSKGQMKKSDPELITLDSDSDDDHQSDMVTVFGSNITLDLLPEPDKENDNDDDKRKRADGDHDGEEDHNPAESY